MAEFGIAMDGRAPLQTIAAQAQAAEQGGASTLWLACHLFLRDPVTTAALALAATKKIKIALMAMSPYSTHPVYIAMAAASLDEVYPGRSASCCAARTMPRISGWAAQRSTSRRSRQPMPPRTGARSTGW